MKIRWLIDHQQVWPPLEKETFWKCTGPEHCYVLAGYEVFGKNQTQH